MSVLSFLSDAAWPILFLLFGLTMLFSPQDKVQEILLVMDYLAM